MKVDRVVMTVLLSGALALPVMAQSTGSSSSGSSDQNSAQQGQASSSSSGQSTPQSDQQSDTSSGAKKSKASKSKAKMSGDTNTAASGTSMKTISRKDRMFMEKAAAGGMEEVDLGNAVKDKASDQQVKDFANKMVTDHTKANDELQALMTQKGLSAPTAIPAKNKAKDDKLKAKSGADLDKAYMADMVKDHDKDVKEFQDEATNGNDPDVKAWAAKTVTTLQEHDKMAHDIAQKVGAQASGKQGSEGKKQSKAESKNP
jgi:putative membrane protein